MRNKPWFVPFSLMAAACVFLIVLNVGIRNRLSRATGDLGRYRRTISDLKERVRQAESKRDSANQKTRELRDELSALISQRRGDSVVIEQLWHALRPDLHGGEKDVRYDGETIRELLKSSDGNLETVIAQMLTAEGIAATLEEHSGDPTYWVAAASLVQDKDAALKYLEEAARLFPKSAVVLSSLVEALMAKGQFDETTMDHIAQLKQVDPANSLPDYYEANCRFQSGDIQGALQSLAEASLKDRFADNGMDLLMARYNFFLGEGCSDSIAMGLSAFTLPLSNMAMLRDVARRSIEQARDLISTGQYEDALRIADSVVRTGRNVSSSGRFLIYDLVGMALQQSSLNEQRRVYEGLGNAFQVEEIDAQLRAIKDRSSVIKVMANSFEEVFQNMSEEDIANYVEGIIRNGEFSTLRDMPGVAEALERAREQAR
jgi:tetratricopeptide (TPR) repeat protein